MLSERSRQWARSSVPWEVESASAEETSVIYLWRAADRHGVPRRAQCQPWRVVGLPARCQRSGRADVRVEGGAQPDNCRLRDEAADNSKRQCCVSAWRERAGYAGSVQSSVRATSSALHFGA